MSKKRFAPKLKIKKGDSVVVIAGAYKDREKNPVEKKYDEMSAWKLSGRNTGMRI